MTCDHVGAELFPQCQFLRVIGRLALPIFAYMIAEGCRYTKNRKRYLMSVAAVAVVCQIVYFIAEKSVYQCILVTFSLSISLIYIIDYAKTKKTAAGWSLVAAAGIMLCFLSVILPAMLKGVSNFRIDYGIWGILLPVIIYFSPGTYKVYATILALVPVCLAQGGIQWWSMAAVALLLLYNGKRGKADIKNLFYIYYPAHLAGIYLISYLLK